MKKLLSLLLLACLGLQSCHFSMGTVGVWRNKTIDQDVKDEIAVLNKKLFKSIMSGNGKGVKQLMSEALLKQSGKTIDTIVNDIGDKLKAKDFKILDEFYVKNSDEVTSEILKSDHETISDYQLEFTAINKKTYASVLVTTGLPVNYMITAIYGQYDNGWKINIIEIGQYSIMDQTAPEYYQIATDKYAKGNYIDAGDMINVSSQLAHPGGKYFYYLKEHDMKDTYDVIMQGLKDIYKFPLELADVKTKPQLFHISPQIITDGEIKGVFPLVSYITHIPFKDTIALRAENLAIQNTIGSVLHGIEKNKPCIVYRAFNTMPSDSVDAPYYQYFQQIKYSTHY